MDKILSKAFKISDVQKIEEEINDMVLEIKEKDINNIVIKDDEIKKDNDDFEYTNKDLTEDGVFTIDANLRKISFLDEKQAKQLKEKNIDEEKAYKIKMTKKVICCSYVKMGKHPLTNTYHLKPKERIKLQELMYSYNGKNEEEINEEFNEVCKEYIFEDYDYSKTPIYNA